VKKHTNSLIPVLYGLICLLLLASACRRDPCKRLDCVEGACVDGACVCNPGYGGDRCEKRLNAAFDGLYDADERCLAGDDDYTVRLTPQPGTADSVLATGLWGKAWPITLGTEQASGRLISPRKRFGSIEISLLGTLDEIDEDILNLSFRLYYVGHAGSFDQCTATLTRQ
jgi:hypothetical protein